MKTIIETQNSFFTFLNHALDENFNDILKSCSGDAFCGRGGSPSGASA